RGTPAAALDRKGEFPHIPAPGRGVRRIALGVRPTALCGSDRRAGFSRLPRSPGVTTMHYKTLLFGALLPCLGLSGCATNTETGMLAGGLGGATIGALAGGCKHGLAGAAIGGVAGTALGGLAGAAADKSEARQAQAIAAANSAPRG